MAKPVHKLDVLIQGYRLLCGAFGLKWSKESANCNTLRERIKALLEQLTPEQRRVFFANADREFYKVLYQQ